MSYISLSMPYTSLPVPYIYRRLRCLYLYAFWQGDVFHIYFYGSFKTYNTHKYRQPFCTLWLDLIYVLKRANTIIGKVSVRNIQPFSSFPDPNSRGDP
jgi:hypothetical protein